MMTSYLRLGIIGLAVGLCLVVGVKTFAPNTYLEEKSYIQSFLDPTEGPKFAGAYNFTPADNATKGRLFLFHGLRADKSFWNDAPYIEFVTLMAAAGYELVAIDLPWARVGDFASDAGRTYCNGFLDMFSQVRASVNSKYGSVNKEIVLGVSWGGCTL
jgi:pimeloyl-ACP methyl ester carboxylesterase